MGWKVKRLKTTRTRKVSLAEVLDAIEQNGLPQAKGTFWRGNKDYSIFDDNFTVDSACALGQAALNLSASYRDVEGFLNHFRNTKGSFLGFSIEGRNDTGWKLQTIAAYYRERFAENLNDVYDLEIQYSVEKDN